MSDKYKLILGSGSPRRRELLSYLNIPFDIIVSDIDESFDLKDRPQEVAEKLAFKKGAAIAKITRELAFIIAADTIVVLDTEIIGKPKNLQEAESFLSKLSGKKHQVITGFSFFVNEQKNTEKWREYVFSETSQVEFEVIEESIMKDYLKTKESLDKAGAYGIQGASLPFVKKILGSYSNIVGLPINRVHQEMMAVLGKNLKERFK